MSIQISVPLGTLTLRLGGQMAYWLGSCVIDTPSRGHHFGPMIPEAVLSSSVSQATLQPRVGDLMSRGETYDEAIYAASLKEEQEGKEGKSVERQDLVSLSCFNIGGQRYLSANLIIREGVYGELDAILRTFSCRDTILSASVRFDGFAAEGRNLHMPTVEQFVAGTKLILATQVDFVLGITGNPAKVANGTEWEPQTPTAQR